MPGTTHPTPLHSRQFASCQQQESADVGSKGSRTPSVVVMVDKVQSKWDSIVFGIMQRVKWGTR